MQRSPRNRPQIPVAVIATLALCLVPAIAQTSSRSVPADFVAPPSSQSCPVDFYVSRPSAIRLDRAADHLAAPKHDAQLGISVHALGAQNIASVTLVIHAWRPGSRLTPASGASASEVTETFTLNESSPHSTRLLSAISLHRSSLVLWVDLSELHYTDGSTWRRSGSSSCIAAPSGYQPVAALR